VGNDLCGLMRVHGRLDESMVAIYIVV
jgi:hypothetical protein